MNRKGFTNQVCIRIMYSCVDDFGNIVFYRCLSRVVDNKSPSLLKIASVCTCVCKYMVLQSAYWGPRSNCVRGVLYSCVRVVISREAFQKVHLRAIAHPLTTIYNAPLVPDVCLIVCNGLKSMLFTGHLLCLKRAPSRDTWRLVEHGRLISDLGRCTLMHTCTHIYTHICIYNAPLVPDVYLIVCNGLKSMLFTGHLLCLKRAPSRDTACRAWQPHFRSRSMHVDAYMHKVMKWHFHLQHVI